MTHSVAGFANRGDVEPGASSRHSQPLNGLSGASLKLVRGWLGAIEIVGEYLIRFIPLTQQQLAKRENSAVTVSFTQLSEEMDDRRNWLDCQLLTDSQRSLLLVVGQFGLFDPRRVPFDHVARVVPATGIACNASLVSQCPCGQFDEPSGCLLGKMLHCLDLLRAGQHRGSVLFRRNSRYVNPP